MVFYKDPRNHCDVPKTGHVSQFYPPPFVPGVLLLCGVALGFPSPYPGPRPGPAPAPAPAPAPGPHYGGGYPGYGYPGYGIGLVEEVITPPVIPPVLNTVDVYDIATLGVIPAPPVEYIYPAVGYEAFGLGGYPEYFGGIVGEYGYGYPGGYYY